MTKQQARRAVNLFLASTALQCDCDWPSGWSDKDRRLFFQELSAKGNEILDRAKASRVPLTLDACLLAAVEPEQKRRALRLKT